MRMMIDPQPEFNFHASNLKLTNDYYAKYECISQTLDENRQIIEVVQGEHGPHLFGRA